MRILLVSPWDPRHVRFRSPLKFLISFPGLTLPLLKALVPQDLDAEVVVFDEFADKRVPEGKFDVVGISATVADTPRAFELADMFKARGSFVVLGGHFPTLLPDEALQHADAVVQGTASECWPRLLRDFAAGHTDRIYSDAPDTPFPDVYADRSVTRTPPYAPVCTMVASEGCPNHCSFCLISSLAPFRHRAVESVVSELRFVERRNIIFHDPNFFADRRYALQLMKEMEPLRLRWGCTATVAFGFDDELMTAAKRAGCYGVLIGFESLNRETLLDVDKKFAQPEEYRQAIENIHRHGMTINGTFILGLDTDTERDLELLPARVRSLGVDLPIFFVLTPAPGSQLFRDLDAQGRIIDYDLSHYTHAAVVYQPLSVTPERLAALYRQAWAKTYTMSGIIRRVFGTPGTSPLQKLVVLAMNLGFKFLGRDY